MQNNILLLGKMLKLYNDSFVIDNIYNDEHMDIQCTCSPQMMENIRNYVHINDYVGVRGHLENKDGVLNVICDKFTCLSSKHGTEEGGEIDE